ncbi:DctP family TRAP transporter solute-binding subunit [Propionivibrio sp.]|uniref:DctP family TRAP transporter solute-binding subunit n=1 Tax=Propionivibrio sp. TaxID=2212460 RepID=UPI00272DE56B|nr:DctP family TRAP transporter solute-binding subunit [Propionivibrio sp.]
MPNRVAPLLFIALTSAMACLPARGGEKAGIAEVREWTIRFGHLNNPDHPISLGVRKFAEAVRTRSNGRMEVVEYASNELGTEQQQTLALRGGTQEMQAPATSSLVGLVKELGVIDFPFAVGTYRQGFALVDGPLGEALKRKLPEKGLVALAFWDLGFRNATNNRRPIARLEDFEGLKLRVIPNPVARETFRVLKSHPVPLSFRDLYPALEIRAVDGQENPFNVIVSNRFYKVQKYVSATHHVYATNIILVGKPFWDRLTADERNILQEAALEARDYQRRVSLDAARQAVEALQRAGMHYNEVTATERERMSEAVRPVVEKFLATYDPEIQRLYQSEIARVRRID